MKGLNLNPRIRGLRASFRWLELEDGIKGSPMGRMKPPTVPELPPPVLRADELRRLFAVCEKDTGIDRRRAVALLRVLTDTGGRRADIGGLCRQHHAIEVCPGSY